MFLMDGPARRRRKAHAVAPAGPSSHLDDVATTTSAPARPSAAMELYLKHVCFPRHAYFASATPWGGWGGRNKKGDTPGARPADAADLAKGARPPPPPPPSSSSSSWRLPSLVEWKAGAKWPSVLIPLPSLGGGGSGSAASTPPPARRATLVTVTDFFEGARATARAVFDELDADGDGVATEADVRRALKARGLPQAYAARLIRDARGPGRWWTTSMTWPDFARLMQAREPGVLRSFTDLGVNAAGRLDAAAIRSALARCGVAPDLSADAARSMLRVLGAEEDGAASYRHWRAFVSLLPPPGEEEDGGGGGGGDASPVDGPSAGRQRRARDDATQAARLWYESAACLPVGVPAASLEAEAAAAASSAAGPGGRAGAAADRGVRRASLWRAAAAGGLSSGITTAALFPLDSLKTRLQVSAARSGGGLGAVVAAARAAPVADVYRGIVPATAGSFFSHGIRASAYEAALAGLTALAASAAAAGSPAAGMGELRRQALASGGASIVGVLARLPTEVLKQRLQVGAHANARDAFFATVREGGPRALFRGGVATLVREVPFYGVGMALFTGLKNFADGASATGGTPTRELSAPELLALGAAAGALSSFFTTPADVIKSVIMTSPPSSKLTAAGVVTSILATDGVRGLWRGALPRALWVAPQGAMTFGIYELVRGPRRSGGGGGSGGGEGRKGDGSGGQAAGDDEDEKSLLPASTTTPAARKETALLG